MATTPISTLLGAYIGEFDTGTPSAQAITVAQYDSFVNAMGQSPSMLVTYVDSTQPESQWVSDAQWEANSWQATPLAQNLLPIIGIPMASSANGETADQSFQNIMSGSEDSIFNGIFQAYAGDGFKTLYIRPGWEMSGNWYPWSVTPSNVADYVAAFQHIAGLAHAFTGANIQVVWNPAVGGTSATLASMYPGNSAVDVIGLDTYGAPINYDASPSDTSTSPTDISLTDVLNLAKQMGKPFALPETGGVDPSFPQALANVVAQSGVPVAFMNLWDINDGSGNLSWSNPSDNLPATAAAWKAAYQTIANATAALGSSMQTPTPTAAPVPAANDTVIMAGSTAAITDASGNNWTITNGAQVAVNGTIDAATANVTEMAYVNGTIWQLNSAGDWYGETTPNDSWAPTLGTLINPLPATPTPTPAPVPSANDTVIMAGSTAAITDASGNNWTITNGAQVVVNGTVDAVTANVTEMAYVNGTIWQLNSAGYWYGETTPNDSWAPTLGTLISPLPATPTPTPAPVPSANDTVIMAGSTAAITDASGNNWTITNGAQVVVNGTIDAVTANVTEMAYVNGTIWQLNSAGDWYGETTPNDSWAPTLGTLINPLPATPTPTPAPVPSANDTVIMAGSTAAITDASGNNWTITNGAQVVVNGTIDAVTANVTEMAYVNGTIWQLNSAGDWYGETTPNDSWAPTLGTLISPLPQTVTVAAGTATVSQSNVSIVATEGTHMIFISGSNNMVSLQGGQDTITDTGNSNTYIIPAAGNGYDTLTSDVLKLTDTLDFRSALVKTSWAGSASTLGSYIHVTDSSSGAVVAISATPNGTALGVVTIQGGTSETLTSILAHSIT